MQLDIIILRTLPRPFDGITEFRPGDIVLLETMNLSGNQIQAPEQSLAHQVRWSEGST